MYGMSLVIAVFFSGVCLVAAAPATNLLALAAPSVATMPAMEPPVIRPRAAALSSAEITAVDRDRILTMAGAALVLEPVTITKYHAKFSPGTANDFYSNGDTWWPDPTTADGLPYKQRPGKVNPDNFNEHRRCVWQLRDNVTALAAAYQVTGNDRYAAVAAEWLRVFFVDPATRMNPDLRYAQAVPGVATGRSFGFDDVLPLSEIPAAVKTLQRSPKFPPEVLAGVKKWSGDYLEWMMNSSTGDEAAEMGKGHNIVYWLEIAAFADFVGDQERVNICRTRFKYFLLPNQVGADGAITSLPRGKPFNSLMAQSDSLAALCQVLSTTDDNLWQFTTSNGRNIRQTVDYFCSYLEDKSKWRRPSHDAAPPRESNLVFAALAYNEPKYLELWKTLAPDITNDELRRYCPITQPVLWIR